MDDKQIIELYFARDEQAIGETKISYGRLLRSIAMRILDSQYESEECENDTYLRAWNSIPPTRPSYLSAFLSKITRNLAINRLRELGRRPKLSTDVIFEEISELVPSVDGDITEDIELRDAINGFLESLGRTKRQIFVKRYFFMRDIKCIANELGLTVASVKVTLHRVKNEFKDYLESRGIVI